jgi:hypothetical protein
MDELGGNVEAQTTNETGPRRRGRNARHELVRFTPPRVGVLVRDIDLLAQADGHPRALHDRA